jgi:hypothetical protein
MQNIKLAVLAIALLLTGWGSFDDQPAQGKETTPAAEQKPNIREAKREEIPFDYDANVFARVEVESEPKAIAQDGVDGFPDEAPAHDCFRLEDKRALPAFEKGPRYFSPAYSTVCIIPLTDITTKNFKKAYPYLAESAVKLRRLLQRRPATLRSINDLPFNNAGGSIESKVQYLNFKTGSGVLFLTQYTQEMLPNPINNEELTCNFQGLTNDNGYYIAARLAITHPSLPRGIDFTDHIKRDMKGRYLKRDERKLNRLTEESFQPSLRTLKTMISSISVK